MLAVIVASALVALLAAAIYLGLERLGPAGLGMTALRTVGMAALLLLLLNPAISGRVATQAPTILLDASLSMTASGGRWTQALDTARALARGGGRGGGGGGGGGTILRFGSRIAGFDTLPPEDGATMLADGLRVARARGGPIVIVTDGEISDAASLTRGQLAGAGVVLLARPPRPDAAVLDAAVPTRIAREDSLAIQLTVGTWNAMPQDSARVAISVDGRLLVRKPLSLPPAPGTARRRVVLPPRALPEGPHVLDIRLEAAGDEEPRDDARARPVIVAQQPQVVVLAAPADWEARFLVRELNDIARGAVRGYALIQPSHWVDMHTLKPVPEETVRSAATGAGVLIMRGNVSLGAGGAGARWRWIGGAPDADVVAGDWYIAADRPSSPLAGRLGAIRWDSIPPLNGVVSVPAGAWDWTALSARLGRRGAERPVVLGRDSLGTRRVVVAGEGLWRWALRGGASREAYRALISATLEWLLRSDGVARRVTLTSSDVVTRGLPVAFRFSGDSVPDSLQISVTRGGETQRVILHFGADSSAQRVFAPGVYHWATEAGERASGRFVVEEYSDEFHPQPMALGATAGDAVRTSVPIRARQGVWLFLLVVAALAGEWVWRHRQGLP